MYPELAVDNDAGARAVSSRVNTATLHTNAYAIFIASSAAERGFWIGGGDGWVRFAPVGRFAPANLVEIELGATPLCGVTSSDGKGLFVGLDDGKLVHVTRRGSRKIIYQADHWIEHLVSDPTTGMFACACGRKAILFDVARNVVHEYEDHPSTLTDLAFSPDGKKLAVSHYDGVSVWHAKSGKRASQLHWHGSHTGIAWGPNGRYIVTTTQDKELHGWRMPAGTDVKMSGYPTKIRSIDWTADGRYLTASGADTVTSWNFEGNGPSGKPPLEFGYVFNGIVNKVATHSEQCIIAAGYNNGTVLIGTIEHTNAWIARPPGGGAITDLCWYPDGEHVVAGTETGELTLMRLERGFCEEMFG